MTTLVTGDFHLSDNPRDRYRHEFQKRLRGMVKKHDVTLTIILGDLTDVKDYHGAVLVNEIADHLDQLSELCHVIILKGNHDYLGDPDNPFFKWIGKVPNIKWINEPMHTSLNLKREFIMPFGNALFLPHTNNYEKDWEHVSTEKRFDWVFAHNTFEGAKVGARRLDGIPLSIFPSKCRVISGDIHYPQDVGKQLTYVGAPYTCHFGDSYEPRVILIDDNGKIHSIPCEGRQKRLIEIKSLKELDKYDMGEDILKIRYVLPSSKSDKWPDIKAEIKEWGKGQPFIIDAIHPVMEHEGTDAIVRTRGSRKTDDELIRDYVKRTGASGSTLKTGLKLIGEV